MDWFIGFYLDLIHATGDGQQRRTRLILTVSFPPSTSLTASHTLLDRPRTLFSCSVLRSHRCRVDAAGRAALLFRRWGGYGITGPSFPSLLHLSSFTRSYSRALRSGEAIIGSWQLRTAKLDVKEGRLPR